MLKIYNTLEFFKKKLIYHKFSFFLKGVKLEYNDRFVWNNHLLQPLLKTTNSFEIILPIIHGSVIQKKIQIDHRIINIILISRRSRFAAGARYLKRGIENNGNVANEVETEQILFEENSFNQNLYKISSFIQVI